MRADRPLTDGRVLCAPDKFKGTHTAAEVAAAIARGVRAAGAEAVELPLADGGDGTGAVLMAALGGERRTALVTGPLGDPVEAGWVMLADGTAVVEAAEASGLALLGPGRLDAWAATSRGTGELIAVAAAAGAETILVAPGGSASTDGGAGALEGMAEADARANLIVLCDAEVPFEASPRRYGPQKGADPELVRQLEERLDALASRWTRDPRGLPLTGSGGGMSGGLWAAAGAKLVGGAAYVMDAVGFGKRVADCHLAITGEGRIDSTSGDGKVVGEVAARCAAEKVFCHAIAGKVDIDRSDWPDLGLAGVEQGSTLEQIAAAAQRICAGAAGH